MNGYLFKNSESEVKNYLKNKIVTLLNDYGQVVTIDQLKQMTERVYELTKSKTLISVNTMDEAFIYMAKRYSPGKIVCAAFIYTSFYEFLNK